MFIDLHCDTISVLYRCLACHSLRCNSLQVDLEKLRRGNVQAQFFAMYVDRAKVKSPREACLCLIERFYQEIAENPEEIIVAKNAADLEENRLQNKIAAFLTIEEGAALEGTLDNLKLFYDLGVRLITLTWNYPNEIGFPCCGENQKGLTEFGKAVVAEMNRLKMLIDVSHLSDEGFFDVARLSKAPFVASHSNSRHICPHCRNLTDQMIRVLAECGGVMGLNFSGDFLAGKKESRIEDMMRHICHILRVGGSDVLALGTDFDGTESELEIADAGQLEKLYHAMKKGGLTFEQIEKICHLNCRRILKECL